MRVRILVADQSEAFFYDTDARGAPLRRAGRIADASARLHDRDLKSDRPGRVFDRAPAAASRRGAVGHHSTGGERRPRKQAAQRFARRIAAALDKARREDRFDGLVLMSGPPFLGSLRTALPQSVRARLLAEVAKDLVHQDESVVRDHLPREFFRTLPRVRLRGS